MSPWEGAESRDVPRARTPAWISIGEPFEGKGTGAVVGVFDSDPQVGLGFFSVFVRCRSRVHIPPKVASSLGLVA